ncbi:MAG: hypothetical protein LLG37_07255 [Spirochaetia bacterium]|nr:hypothetical protein [Spirochaetia bacterium]
MKKNNVLIILAVAAAIAVSACSKTAGPSGADIAQAAIVLSPTPDMKKWEIGERYTDFAARAGAGTTEFKGRIFICGGRQGRKFFDDVWATSDCVYWVTATAKAPFGPRSDFGFVNYGGKMWVIGGTATAPDGGINYFNDVWSSPDGVSWTVETVSAAFPKMAYMAVSAFKNEIYMTGGWDGRNYYDDTWHSKDGVKWMQSKPDSPDKIFPGRRSHASSVYSDRLWISGGAVQDRELNDVWYSSNGVDWKSATPSAAFSPRAGHSMVTFKDRLWVIGGGDKKTGLYADVWWSVNGYNWVSVTASAGFGKRAYMGCAVFDGAVWLVSGQNGAKYAGDIWSGR